MAWDGMIEITTKLTNTGAREATEVVQLYVHDVVASRVRPVRELKGFKKVSHFNIKYLFYVFSWYRIGSSHSPPYIKKPSRHGAGTSTRQ